MPTFSFDKALKLGRGIKGFLQLDAGITRGLVPNLRQRIRVQARQIEARNEQLERIRQRLSEEDLQGARWEASKDPAAWEYAKAFEVAWWRGWITSRGLDWPEDYKPRLDPEQPLQDYVIRCLSAPPGSTVSILDVGAGPMTKLGKSWEGRTVQITAIDPLADEYTRLLAEADITPPVPTQPGEVERLTERFATNRFDLVHMQNALDHSHDPMLGIQQMLEVVKPGCYVLLFHAVNEGHHANYTGFHHWNLCADNGHFVIWNRYTRISVNEALGDLAKVTVEEFEGDEDEVEGEILVSLRKNHGSA